MAILGHVYISHVFSSLTVFLRSSFLYNSYLSLSTLGAPCARRLICGSYLLSCPIVALSLCHTSIASCHLTPSCTLGKDCQHQFSTRPWGSLDMAFDYVATQFSAQLLRTTISDHYQLSGAMCRVFEP